MNSSNQTKQRSATTRFKTAFRWNGGRTYAWQAAAVLLVLVYIAGLHWSNDGLWYQGDSPRHAANGLFWWDFITSFPVNPIKFALSYYARYPVIHPTGYPPLFYLIEGLAFGVLGASPFIAKGLVLTFALLGGLYLTAWLRRWICEEAGWAGALLILQPGIIIWTNAVMLNIPSMALGLAALYHARRWIETPASRHLYLTAFFALAGILTYIPTGIVVFVILAWVLFERRWMLLWDRRVFILGLLSALILLPCALVMFRWTPTHFGSIYPTSKLVQSFSMWTYYLETIPALFTAPVLVLAMLGAVFGLRHRRWRQEGKLLLIWFFVCYIGFSYLRFREPRYVLLLGPPSVLLSMVGLVSLLQWGAEWLKKPSWVFLTGMALLLLFHLSQAPFVKVPTVDGFQEVVAFLERVAPEEIIFYDGNFDGVLTFYLRAGDQYFKRGVVLGSKLLYANTIFARWRLTERVSSPAGVVQALRKEGGCKWVAIERHGVADRVPAARFLRQAATGPEFELVKSFPIRTRNNKTWVDVYRFLPPVEKPDKVDLPFPGLGKDAVFRVKPIEKNSKGIR